MQFFFIFIFSCNDKEFKIYHQEMTLTDSKKKMYFCRMFKLILRFIFSILIITAVSCSKYQKVVKSNDFELKYNAGVEYYQKGDYYRALQLFEQVAPLLRGTAKAEQLYYYYAMAYYKQKDYLLASYYFDRFAKDYPASVNAEEALFLAADCKYRLSPTFTLDQGPTYEAIQAFQVFINAFPASPKVQHCNELIDELRLKLQTKDYTMALQYYKMQAYEAAVIAFTNLLEDYPETTYREDAMYNIFKAWYYYAKLSIETKQAERFSKALSAGSDFLALYPESPKIKEVQALYDQIMKNNIANNKLN